MPLDREAHLPRGIFIPCFGSITSEAAKAILGINLRKSDLARFNALSSCAKHGILTDDEQDELENLLYIGNYLTLLHADARLALKR